MPVDLAVVFPNAGVGGGVERVAAAVLAYESSRRSVCFVGETTTELAVRHVPVDLSSVPRSLRPIAFRRRAARALGDVRARTVLSFGANCPPGDVYWVQSVHAAWLADGGDLRMRGVRVPSRARRLLLRHQVLLRLERDYFTGHQPRAIMCTSAKEVDDLARIYGVSRAIMQVVPNGFDGGEFSPGRRVARREVARRSLGIGDDQRAVLLVANEWHRKGLGPLLQAVSLLNDPRVHLHLVGRVSPADYEPMAQRLGLADRMHWHGPSHDVGFFYAAADVFALPTTYEPFGIVIVEAMASGLPVVTSRLAGAAEAIEHGVSGLLLDDPRDASEIAAALDAALSGGDALGEAAARSAAPYEWNSVLARVDKILFRS